MSTRKLTVLQVLPALQSGGVERGVLEVADALVAAIRGEDVQMHVGALAEGDLVAA